MSDAMISHASPSSLLGLHAHLIIQLANPSPFGPRPSRLCSLTTVCDSYVLCTLSTCQNSCVETGCRNTSFMNMLTVCTGEKLSATYISTCCQYFYFADNILNSKHFCVSFTTDQGLTSVIDIMSKGGASKVMVT